MFVIVPNRSLVRARAGAQSNWLVGWFARRPAANQPTDMWCRAGQRDKICSCKQLHQRRAPSWMCNQHVIRAGENAKTTILASERRRQEMTNTVFLCRPHTHTQTHQLSIVNQRINILFVRVRAVLAEVKNKPHTEHGTLSHRT